MIDTFYKLTPSDEIEKGEIYFKRLDWAIKDEDIKNIAVTGNYSSGKSSVIKSYLKRRTKNDFINISLAFFNNPNNIKEIDNMESKIEEEKLAQNNENLIEKSILQQIFYKAKDSEIPYSRFKKINNIDEKTIAKKYITYLIIAGIVVYLISCIFYRQNVIELLKKIFIGNSSVINCLSIGVAIYLILYLLYKIFCYIIKSFNMSNIKLKNNKIEIDLNSKNIINESIFNKYIDELIYFFEATKYEIVIFEDIDRFNNSERIFTKLRELNSLLNNSQNIDKKITFIYAVRDDIFDTEERIKFFDYIIPIVPVVNNGNSKEKLIKMIEKDGLRTFLPYDFISKISLYITDMRLLYNIYNEFLIYYEVIKELPNINLMQLFSIIVYKNIYPGDFAKMKFKKSIIDNIFIEKQNNKEKVIKKEMEILNEKERELKELKKINANEILKNIKELKRLIWGSIEKIFEERGYPIYENQIKINDTKYNILEFVENDIVFQEFIKYGNVYNTQYQVKVTIAEIEDDLDGNIENRIEIIENKNKYKIVKLQNEIKIIYDKIEKVQDYSLETLLQEYDVNDFVKKEKQSDLLIFLLINGYINENYEDYLSYFYEGTLSSKDKAFIINVNSKRMSSFEFKLDNINIVIDSIQDRSFSKPEILNFALINYLLENSSLYTKKIERIFEQLFNYDDISIEFIISYILNSENERKIFLNELIKYSNNNIWNYIENTRLNDQYRRFLYLIIKYVDFDTIVEISENNKNFKSRISEEKNFLRFINKNTIEKVKKILEKLEVKFVDIGKNSKVSPLYEYIIENNNYEINLNNLINILKYKYEKKLIEVYEENYSTIKNLRDNFIFEYINESENINCYINNVILNKEISINDKENDIIEILNNEYVTFENKKNIIKKQKVIIQDIESVEEQLWDELLINNKININWKNIIKYYSEKGFSEILINFLNVHYQKIDKDISNIILNTSYQRFKKELVNVQQIKLNTFENLLKQINEKYNSEDIDEEKVEYKKMVMLIQKNSVIISKDMYEKIRENYKQALPIYISKMGIQNFINEIEQYDSQDIENIILCKNIKNKSKVKIIQNLNDNIVCNSLKEVEEIIDLLLKEETIKYINLNFINSIIKYDIELAKKLKLILLQYEYINSNNFNELLKNLGQPYNEIFETNKRPILPYSDENTKIVEIIKQYNYIGKSVEEKEGYRVYKKDV